MQRARIAHPILHYFLVLKSQHPTTQVVHSPILRMKRAKNTSQRILTPTPKARKQYKNKGNLCTFCRIIPRNAKARGPETCTNRFPRSTHEIAPPEMGEDEQHQEINAEAELYCWGNTPEEEYYTLHGVKSTKAFYTSPRGITLFTRSWLPPNSPPRGLIFMVHGYGNDISWTFQTTTIFLAQNGYACFALDLEGHGKSQGLRAYVPNVDLVVDDCLSFFNFILSQNLDFQNLPKFLHGESMGGAICLLIHLKAPALFNGAVLIAPMCKISDKVRPRWPIPEVLTIFARFVPTLPIVPTADLLEKSVRVPEKRITAALNPARYKGKPRLGTVLELLRVTDYINSRLFDVDLPFLVLHGSDDVVTDPQVSKELYELARSKDKTIKIYDEMLHSMLYGETDENIATVRGDILKWLNERS